MTLPIRDPTPPNGSGSKGMSRELSLYLCDDTGVFGLIEGGVEDRTQHIP